MGDWRQSACFYSFLFVFFPDDELLNYDDFSYCSPEYLARAPQLPVRLSVRLLVLAQAAVCLWRMALMYSFICQAIS